MADDTLQMSLLYICTIYFYIYIYLMHENILHGSACRYQ